MSAEKIRILGIVGPSGCGKDTAASYLADENPSKYVKVKLYTTRPKRNELDDGYTFVSAKTFLDEILSGAIISAQEFRGWYYGLSMGNLYKNYINVLPLNNEMTLQLTEEHYDNYDLKIIGINTDPKQRLQHIIDREENPDCYEICRRFLSDKGDYEENKELINLCNAIIENRYTQQFYRNIELVANDLFVGD